MQTTTTQQLLLNKLPASAREAYSTPGLVNNLLSAAVLADAGCNLYFNQTGYEVEYNGEIIL